MQEKYGFTMQSVQDTWLEDMKENTQLEMAR
jgi:hypothetical protein